jgi:chromosome segregation ATPase
MPAQGQNIIELGFDVASLDAQKKQILDILLQVYDAGKKIDGTQLKPISLPGFSDLKTQTDAQKKAVDELSLSVKEYSSIQNQRAQTEAKVAAAGSDAAKQLAEQKVQLQQVNKENKDAALAALGLTGAYKELSNQFRQASAEAKNLAAQAIIDPKFSEQAKQAAAVANELNNKLKTIDASVGDFRRNVGNYTGAITILEKSFNDIKEKMDQLNAAGQTNSAEFQNLSKQYGLLR